MTDYSPRRFRGNPCPIDSVMVPNQTPQRFDTSIPHVQRQSTDSNPSGAGYGLLRLFSFVQYRT